MNKFCKIFNTKVSQVLITKCENEQDDPCVRFVFVNKKGSMIEQVFVFNNDEERDHAYESIGKEKAMELVEHSDFKDM